jgi:tetratricopeptide (TPR) repeat protein
MNLADKPVARFAIAALLLVCLLVGAQALAASSAPAGGVASTGRLMGQTSFAYLGGIRTFAAAVLWNRLDPLFHDYYSANFDKDFVVFLPTIRMVLALDPQFEQGYYSASYYLAKSGLANHNKARFDQGLELAREGIFNNPNSGILRSNYIQVLQMQDPVANQAEMLKQAKIGLGPNITFANIDDEFEALGVYRIIFEKAGDLQTATILKRIQNQLETQGAQVGAERQIPIPPIPFKKQ